MIDQFFPILSTFRDRLVGFNIVNSCPGYKIPTSIPVGHGFPGDQLKVCPAQSIPDSWDRLSRCILQVLMDRVKNEKGCPGKTASCWLFG